MSESVKFSGKWTGALGVIAGAAIALGVPAIVLTLGAAMGATVQTVLVVIAVLGGGLMSLLSAVLAIVIPVSVTDEDDDEGARAARAAAAARIRQEINPSSGDA